MDAIAHLTSALAGLGRSEWDALLRPNHVGIHVAPTDNDGARSRVEVSGDGSDGPDEPRWSADGRRIGGRFLLLAGQNAPPARSIGVMTNFPTYVDRKLGKVK